MPVPAPHVSIILPVRNEEANIDACLTSLLAQDYPDFAVTVIDDGSTDATPCLLKRWKGCDHRITAHRIDELPESWAGKAHALHTGVTKTCSEWILFTDADTRHAHHTLSTMMGHALLRNVNLLSMRTYAMTLVGSATPLLMPMSEIILAQLTTPSQLRDEAFPHALPSGNTFLCGEKRILRVADMALLQCAEPLSMMWLCPGFFLVSLQYTHKGRGDWQRLPIV